jgi:hypothetical protein
VVCPRPAVHEHHRVAVPDDFDERTRLGSTWLSWPTPRATEAVGIPATLSLTCTNPRCAAYPPAAGAHRAYLAYHEPSARDARVWAIAFFETQLR